ncbi:PFS and TPR domain-containing protein [Colletotrichum incanum]|nr:PFS and TPR domain-containing protein [Colletotrichum incanum]
MSDPHAYTVGWICALPTELAAARTFLDEQHPAPKAVQRNDCNTYTLGTMGKHNVVIAVMPKREYGIAAAAIVAKDLVHSFPNVRIGLMVGVGGGALSQQNDIRLGDIVIGSRNAGKSGVIYYDYGKMMQNQGFTEYMMQGPELESKVQKALIPWKRLQKTHSRPDASTDQLYKSDFIHPLNSDAACSQACEANTANIGVLCFEMEAAGLMNHFLCLVIRGICDYSNSHKNKEWQGFAAMVAAAYAKDLLLHIPLNSVKVEKPIREVLNTIQEGLHGLKQTADEMKIAVETMHSDHTILLFSLQQGVQDLKFSKAEDLSIACNPHFVILFPPDPNFMNRPNIWAWTETRYAESERRFALVGLGGFGYIAPGAIRVRVTSPNTSIFWVNASTKATFKDSYRSIAEVLALPCRHNPGVNLMIVDNADDIEMLFSKINSQTDASIPIVLYILKMDNGKILVTSRSWDAAEKLMGNGKMIFRVPTMEEAQAFQLLQNKLDQDVDEVAALRLVHTLGCIPLAVNQAAAYIHKRSRATIQSYLDELQKSEKRKGTLLRSDIGDIWRYNGVSNSVVLTWQLTYFHAQNIPKYMLHGYNGGLCNAEESDDDDDNNDGDLEDDLDMLQSYSLITMTATSGFCEMHSLVQFCTQIWISEFGCPKRWKRLFLQSASHHFPSGVFETWEKCQALMAHVEQLLNEEPTEESDQLEWSELVTNISRYLLMLGDYYRAETAVLQAVRIQTESLAQGHPSTLTSMANLASTYSNQGWWEEAEQLELGADHPDTLSSMANLASTFWNQGWWEEAEKLEVQLGADHPSTLSSMANLASTYSNQGRWEEAEQLEVQVMETSKTKLKADHPNTLTSMANLASTYRNQGRWEEAEKLEVQVMETSKMKLGADHPSTLTSMANLASTYSNQGRWEEAEQLDVQVMEMSKTKLGADHPSTLTSIANLASTFWNQGRWEEAEKLDVQVMETRKTKLGADHPSTLSSMANLAHTWKSQGRRVDAIQLMRDCLGLQQRRLGVNHPDTRSSFSSLEEWEKVPVAKKRIIFKVPKRKKRISFEHDLCRR